MSYESMLQHRKKYFKNKFGTDGNPTYVCERFDAVLGWVFLMTLIRIKVSLRVTM